MDVKPTALPGVLLIQPQLYTDERGYFFELYHTRKYQAIGLPAQFVQDNYSRSRRGTLRGLHYQIRHPQGKLVQVTVGEVFDVAVDLRRRSPYFGRWVGVLLSGENCHQLWIPPGFAHGFYVLSEWAEVLYKVTDYYAPEWDRTILWNDPDLAISWPLREGELPLLSPKDAAGKAFCEAEVFEED
ncbi:MAG: dTDP-4-dehydrorhamnose 3,5-epimerase [Anaerolineales bacterium]|nr:dTDP-4-dehydrorhamnose 3,5-epimerase [Anaerolineales bacterium]MCS7249099.1 dTDP-4-dehydrorhamnose 3,5-epimerase [Anaerolineales bacterium]MDW8162912.1 dTDP-4-dehydrorhamnose 3,5-epimerase [Anaerolineales bacterium]MDW8447071.1 dTDP-4-dehydrorhamnose 3,5-epimerase [Anaerolineales bacterium]